jgi:stage II sporulation protein D
VMRSRSSAVPTRSARHGRSGRSIDLQRPVESRSNRRRDRIPCPVFVRRRWLIAAVLCAVCAAPSAPAGTKLVVTGRGWGHRVGMSQWGAYGYALHGWRWQRILAHYYPGTALAEAPVSKVRVLLADEQTSARVACAGGLRVSDRTGRSWPLKPGTYTVNSKLRLPVGHKRVKVAHGAPHRERFAVVPAKRTLRAPVVFDCPSAPLLWNGNPYHGTLFIRHSGKKVAVINVLALDDYVRGVVAGEMPHTWSIAALAAQAVAARSYALATLKPGKDFDLYSDTRSQVYGGITYETPASNAAVAKTANKVLTYNGHVATTFFFSTSGGRTADVREVWPTLGDIPYLRAVDDPYDVRSPHHQWGPVAMDVTRVARKLGVPSGAVKVVRTPSGHVSAVQIGSRRIDGDTFRHDLGLASTWFEIGELGIDPSRQRVVYGGELQLSLRADGVGAARLQRRIAFGRWKTLANVNGARTVTVQPRAATLYRLEASTVHGPVVSVAVAPKLAVEPTGAEQLSGDVEPVVRSAVTVQREVGASWKVVAHPQVDPKGHFNAPLRLEPGMYRVTIAGDGRYADTTAKLRVTPRLLASLAP